MVVEAGVKDFVDNLAMDFENGYGSVIFGMVMGLCAFGNKIMMACLRDFVK